MNSGEITMSLCVRLPLSGLQECSDGERPRGRPAGGTVILQYGVRVAYCIAPVLPHGGCTLNAKRWNTLHLLWTMDLINKNKKIRNRWTAGKSRCRFVCACLCPACRNALMVRDREVDQQVALWYCNMESAWHIVLHPYYHMVVAHWTRNAETHCNIVGPLSFDAASKE